MSLRPMSMREVAAYHFVPQAVLRCPPSFFAAKGIAFTKGHDDLDEFEVAELSLDDKVPFALHRYRGMPENETTVFLPSQYGLREVARLIQSIVAAFGVPDEAIGWQRTRDDTPF